MTRVNLEGIQSFYASSNARQIPLLGLGVYAIEAGKPTEDAVLWALHAGYRHIDTAAYYGNEASVGNAIRKSGIPRDQIFVTTKLHDDDQGYESALAACELSLEKLGLDYIGVSNYGVHHLKELLGSNPTIRPVVNQIEAKIVSFCESQHIAIEAFSPLSRGHKLQDPVLNKIATKYGKSPAQVMIRWGLQKGYIVLPKSARKDRIEQNADVFDFDLADGDMNLLDSLNEGYVSGECFDMPFWGPYPSSCMSDLKDSRD
ncbi:hypothetical protein BG011_002120 [Mortierella polycephala]|uniref:NADP-dependent oxidoreductase domain-containing protein n=1 Tax=Mortierella polycephala TaxID=41804 RepID=A0A9P6Q7E4_9FUNG|nr:hypothetical protein BG011_002120 [Mortierella polycephala]